MKAGSTYSRVMDIKGPKMLSVDFSPQARLSQHYKEVGLILGLADQSGAKVPLSRLHVRLLESLVESGCGDLDNSAILKAFLL